MTEGIQIQIPAEIVRVVDGDTVEVEFNRRARIRLLDCWAPETRTTDPVEKAKGLEAREALAAKALGCRVVVTIPIEASAKFGDSMTFGRILAHVVTDDDEACNLAEYMVERGLATKERGNS